MLSSFLAALAFYTRLPVPVVWALQFERVACLAPVVGLLIGGMLAGLDWGLSQLQVTPLARSALVVTAWVGLTGGLHLDGAIDAADGLAVPDSSRRLAVMTESTVGAFGVMSAVLLVLLKTAMLADLELTNSLNSWLVLPLAAGWGRWSQQIAIASFPYLKPTGKGAFHKAALRSFWDTVPSLLLLLGLSALPLGFAGQSLYFEAGGLAAATLAAGGLAAGSLVAISVAVWFGRQFGGHTGDTYGAVVEWTETLVLVLWVVWGE